MLVYLTFETQLLLYVLIAFTFRNSAFCSHSIYVLHMILTRISDYFLKHK